MYTVLLMFLSCTCASTWARSAALYDLENAGQYFEEFIKKYEKQYTSHEKEYRFNIFKINLEEMNRLNSDDDADGLIHGINQFADLTLEEFQKSRTGYRRSGGGLIQISDYMCDKLSDEDVPDVDVPESFDWRDKNAVTPVRNQQTCGSCWAFGAIANVESQYAIKYNKHIDLSEQQIIDCDVISNGCCGGESYQGLKTMINIGGVMLEKDYPYDVRGKKNCQFDLSKAVVKVTNCSSYKISSQDKVKQLLYKTGPITIVIKASVLKSYTNGLEGIVTDKKCTGDLNHEVLLVGYGTENDKPYWTVKNSWGNDYDEHGYFRMERSNNPEGACGMLISHMQTVTIE